MAEAREGGPATVILPAHIGAVFDEGRNIAYAYDPRRDMYLAEHFGVKEKDQRDAWIFENIRKFSLVLPGAHKLWKQAVDDYELELKTARDNAKKSIEKGEATRKFEEDIEQTREELLAMMAVSASARAMEESDGSAIAYLSILTQSSPDNLEIDVQDMWGEYLLHDDSEKYWRVVSNPLVKDYYQMILKDMGIKVRPGKDTGEPEPGDENKFNKFSEFEVDENQAKNSNLVKYLRTKEKIKKIKDGKEVEETEKVKYKGGFNRYIKEVLLKDEVDNIREAAARLACDAVLVDKFTLWEYKITHGEDPENKDEFEMHPSPGWGGNPQRHLLEPAFLPRRIKGVYKGKEDSAVLEEMDRAFMPKDIFKDKELKDGRPNPLKDKELRPSMVTHLKKFARFSQAHWIFLGGSRANGIPIWTEKTMREDLPKMVELLDQVYGGDEIEINGYPIGRHVLGVMMARIIYTKVLAAVAESERPGFRDQLKDLFSKEDRPFVIVAKFLFGPDFKAREGFFASLASARTRFVFDEHNPFSSIEVLGNILNALITADQHSEGWGKGIWLRRARAILAASQAYAKGR